MKLEMEKPIFLFLVLEIYMQFYSHLQYFICNNVTSAYIVEILTPIVLI